MSPSRVYQLLLSKPYPGATMREDRESCARVGCVLEFPDVTITHWGSVWGDGQRLIDAALPDGHEGTAEQVHAEIRRVLAIVNAPAVESASSGRTCDEGGLLDSTPSTTPRKRHPSSGGVRVLAEPFDYDEYRAKDLWASSIPKDQEVAIADAAVLRDIAALMGIKPTGIAWRSDLAQSIKRAIDTHTVVSQRLVGAQKEVAERDATIDELRTALEAVAAHVGLVGSDQWAVGDVVVKVGEVAARADKVEDRLRRDDELREQIAVAVGLDGSASLALILDTVTRDRPGREISRLSGLLDVLAAPVTFGERRLSAVERAEWALRRWLAEGKECSARMAQLIEAEVYLDVLGVPAYAAVPSDDPGDASEALTVAERLRLYFGAQS